MWGAPITRREVPPSVAAAASAVSTRKNRRRSLRSVPVDKIRVGRRHRKDNATSTRSPGASPRSGLCSLVVVRPDGALEAWTPCQGRLNENGPAGSQVVIRHFSNF